MCIGVLNKYFDFYSYTPEQDFYADFVDEEICLAGTEILYIPKDVVDIDGILCEPYQALHNRFYPMAARLSNIQGYEGNPDVMTQFGVQFQPETEWIISKRMFRNMKIPERDLRPNEGDLILVGSAQATSSDPVFTNSLFEITYVKRDVPNWPLGRYYVWAINCQLYTVSGEKFETGNAHIDRINTQYSNAEDLKQGINKSLEDKKIELVDFSETNPFGNL